MTTMKNYFSFKLTGKKLLPIWLLFYIVVIVPYMILIFKMPNNQPYDPPSILKIVLYLLLIVISFILTFYITKLTIENVVYKDKTVVFNGNSGSFIGIVLLGYLFGIITFGIYLAWFIRDLHKFFINNSSYNSKNFRFQGKGEKLFMIMLMTVFLPLIIFFLLKFKFIVDMNQNFIYNYVFQWILMIIMIPYMYYLYKWMVNINYKEYNISWDTKFWESCGKIAIELLIMIVTIGIYIPLGMLRLYKYFAERTVTENLENKLKFGYDLDQLNDFLFIWGQLLLTIITIGIYSPWAFCKIGERILSKTYIEVIIKPQ